MASSMARWVRLLTSFVEVRQFLACGRPLLGIAVGLRYRASTAYPALPCCPHLPQLFEPGFCQVSDPGAAARSQGQISDDPCDVITRERCARKRPACLHLNLTQGLLQGYKDSAVHRLCCIPKAVAD